MNVQKACKILLKIFLSSCEKYYQKSLGGTFFCRTLYEDSASADHCARL